MTAPGPSSLSIISGIVRQRLLADPFKDASNFEISIDTPAAAAKIQQGSGKSLLNLFFYRIEPSGFYDAAGQNDRWYVRAQCLMTPFSVDDTVTDDTGTTTIPQGEIDLRVLGEILRYFHENAIIIPENDNEAVAGGLQIVLNALSSQEINQIWATQGEVPYRSSLLYELALVPIVPKVISDPSLPVVAGGATTDVRARLDAPPPAKPSPWPSPRIETGHAADWAPALCFVTAGGKATQSAMLGKGTTTKLALWLAGPVSGKVDLVWEQVDQGVWTTVPSTGVVANVTVPTQTATPPGNEVIDPDNAAAAVTIALARPIDRLAQLLLYAQRTLPDGSTARSNPLIVSIVTGGP